MLSIVFQNAAAVADSLGIQYLWIDTLCIIQDSGLDWAEQAAKMCDIFEGATIIIAASASKNPNHTLFGTRDPIHQEVELYSDPKGDLAGMDFKARRSIAGSMANLDGQAKQILWTSARGVFRKDYLQPVW